MKINLQVLEKLSGITDEGNLQLTLPGALKDWVILCQLILGNLIKYTLLIFTAKDKGLSFIIT